MKILVRIGIGLVCILLFGVILAWPDLRTDWDYLRAKHAYAQLKVGEPKAQVKRTFGLPTFAKYGDQCWTDTRSRWPGGQRTYTLCFARGRLSSKSFVDD